jgi:dolichol-phosphate mannosyltransferase
MLRFALDGIVSFSRVPLTLATYVGFASAALALVGILYALVLRLFTSSWVPGWTAIFIAILFIGGVQLISLGVMGEYIGRIYGEAKRRPLYLLQERLGFRPRALPEPEARRRSGEERAIIERRGLPERRRAERRRLSGDFGRRHA